jgi:aspartate kinase
VIGALKDELALELARRDVDRIRATDDIVIVTVVGSGTRATPGVAARVFGALAKADINVIASTHGSSECNISLVVEKAHGRDAVRQIHREVLVDDAK